MSRFFNPTLAGETSICRTSRGAVMNRRMLLASALALAAPLCIATTQDTSMNQHGSGPFEVKLNLLETYSKNDPGFGRRSIDKQFHGDLEAASQGEMLSIGSAQGSGGYVAIERVTGVLHGRQGSFALQHNATMTKGVPYL